MQHQWQWSIINDLNELSPDICQQLTQASLTATPFLNIDFLQLLAASKSVDGDSGWLSHHILVSQHNHLNNATSDDRSDVIVALVPCYLKSHSYGEYVFDHAWANAYHRYQLPYYPKLLCAVPFTPVTGSRALIHLNFHAQNITEADIFDYLANKKAG